MLQNGLRALILMCKLRIIISLSYLKWYLRFLEYVLIRFCYLDGIRYRQTVTKEVFAIYFKPYIVAIWPPLLHRFRKNTSLHQHNNILQRIWSMFVIQDGKKKFQCISWLFIVGKIDDKNWKQFLKFLCFVKAHKFSFWF